jgi:RNA polymerase sigma-70 factor (ECF subfamily)
MPKTELNNLNEAELLELYYGGRVGESLGVLLNRYMPLVFAICVHYLKNRTKAEDATSEILEKMLNYFKNNEVKNAKALILLSAKNHCLSLLKRKKELVDIQTVEYRLAEENAIDEIMKRETDLELLEDLMLQLPDQQKKCLEMFFFNKKSYEQIQTDFGISYKEVKSHIQNGKRMLRKLFLNHRSNDHEQIRKVI